MNHLERVSVRSNRTHLEVHSHARLNFNLLVGPHRLTVSDSPPWVHEAHALLFNPPHFSPEGRRVCIEENWNNVDDRV